MMIASSYVQQTAWGWQIAAYLFLGGLGGAVGALGIGIERFVNQDGRIGFVSALSGFALLAVGSLLLVLDLLRPLNAIYFWRNPGSWIFWGILSLSGYLVSSVLYAVPCTKGFPFLGPVADALPFLQEWQTATGVVSIALGTFVTVYTGFLLSAAQGISLWHSAGLPVLFTISAFSTGCAYLMLVLWPRRHELSSLFGGIAKLDAALIGTEMVVLFSLYNSAIHSGAAWQSVQMLLGNWIFVIGFIALGLTIPLVIELVEIMSSEGSKSSQFAERLLPAVSVFILIGGYLLRHFTLLGGYYRFPW
jgi:formate-dependent nitrite reductase membrane component NrfD